MVTFLDEATGWGITSVAEQDAQRSHVIAVGQAMQVEPGPIARNLPLSSAITCKLFEDLR
jgi:carotenoid cleavage dioxygenase-like enzyme